MIITLINRIVRVRTFTQASVAKWPDSVVK